MKALTNNALSVALSLALLLWCGPGATAAEKRKRETVRPAPKAQITVTPVRAETNPEFLKRLADPEFNPELAARQTDPGTRTRAAQTVADQFCQDFTVASTLGSDAQGCYLDVKATHNYTFASGGTNAFTLPHGLHITMCPGTQITSVQILSGAWFAGSTFGSTPSGAPWNEVWWTKPCPGSGNYSNIVPSGQPLQFRLRISGLCASTPCPVTVEELTGWAHPSALNFWSCRVVLPLLITQPQYSLGNDVQLCDGGWMTLALNQAPSATAQVTWYKSVGPSCPPANCAMLPLGSPWVLDQGGGPTHNTNILHNTTCYVAVIKDGCVVSVSTVKKIEICPARPNAGIVATPDPGYGPPTMIGQDLHFCGAWKGKLCLNQDPSSCLEVTGWTKNGQPVPNSSGATGKCIDTGLLKPGTCSTTYVFQANMKNACGPSTATWKIVVDGPPKGGTITANPLPPLCYDRATVLTHKTTCGKVVQWEKREETTPCSRSYGPWTVLPGSETPVWWTNDLQKTTEYRVIVDNGACPPAKPPASIRVTVRPKLSATISANQTILCPAGSVKLTASHTWGPPCSYLATYQWFRNGVLIPGATQQSYLPTTGGNYHVVVTGKPCGVVKSNVITVCNPPKLVISGDCCVCPGKTITLTASTLWTPQSCQTNCTYLWSTGATTPTIQVSQPGTYTVQVNCGNCQLPPVSFKVDVCVSQSSACVIDAGVTTVSYSFVRRKTLAQTFIPTQNGSLTKVTHGLQNYVSGNVTSYDLLVTTTVGGLPSWPASTGSNVLFKATGLTIFANSNKVNGVVTIPPGQQPCLTAGTQYALILVPGSPTTGVMQWRGYGLPGPYLNGVAYELNGTTWTHNPIDVGDHGFKLDGVCPCQ